MGYKSGLTKVNNKPVTWKSDLDRVTNMSKHVLEWWIALLWKFLWKIFMYVLTLETTMADT